MKYNSYECSEINGLLTEINRQIFEFKRKYKRDPKIIILSEELYIILSGYMNLINQNVCIDLGFSQIKLSNFFGHICISSLKLTNLDFEIR